MIEEGIVSETHTTPPAAVEPGNQVSGPSVGLLVTGIIGAIFSLGGLISMGLGAGITSLAGFGADWMDEFPYDIDEIWEGAFAMGSSLVGLLVAAFIIYAALKMKEMQQWGLAVAASILAMIPCISPCCIVGLPIGIWCLVVLTRPEVKNAFQ